ncbi:unnamed protein product [Arctia plantaginis]|uniref:Uncharacterized protein n=1 Tax=Arctia plantaginis TaxID=874455 RepID=A0A8S0YM55_ARCPL|nr:unnamed protein product [Arctia plantaginis]
MSSESGESDDENKMETVFEAVSLESSGDPPMEQWSSLEVVYDVENSKRVLQEEGLYDPGAPDICPKYINMSSSSVERHVYYRYPAITDPGIMAALLKPEETIIYSDNGQDLYLALCKEMNQCVVRCFHRELLCDKINLRYYGLNPVAVRAMAMALAYNKFVKEIYFTENLLNTDACYHLGQMLATNRCLVALDLSGCRIGHEGVRHLLANLLKNRTLKILNLSRNEVGDEGMAYFADAVFNGLFIKEVNLSRNNITGKGMSLLVEPFQTYNYITHWDLSYNKLFTPGTYAFLMAIAETTKNVINMNLSWNALSGFRIGQALKQLLTVRDLQHLNLSNNKLQDEAIEQISLGLSAAKKLVSLNLSYNPMTPTDALAILKQLNLRKVHVSCVNMENVTVNKVFLKLLDQVMSFKPKLNVTYGYVVGSFKGLGPDERELLFNRLEYLCKRPKKNKVDIALILLQLQKDKVLLMPPKELFDLVSHAGAPVDNDLMDEVANIFPGPRVGRGGATININAMVEYSIRKFPDRKLPPSPPPEPERRSVPTSEKKPKSKGKKKG